MVFDENGARILVSIAVKNKPKVAPNIVLQEAILT